MKLNIKQAINLSLYYSMKYKISTLSESDFEEFYDATKNLCELILNSDKMYLGSVRREFINQVVVATMGKLVYCPTTYLSKKLVQQMVVTSAHNCMNANLGHRVKELSVDPGYSIRLLSTDYKFDYKLKEEARRKDFIYRLRKVLDVALSSYHYDSLTDYRLRISVTITLSKLYRRYMEYYKDLNLVVWKWGKARLLRESTTLWKLDEEWRVVVQDVVKDVYYLIKQNISDYVRDGLKNSDFSDEEVKYITNCGLNSIYGDFDLSEVTIE